ncbi:FimV/HubP family polar landmark protein [Pseudomonas sp. R5(2019)]|uniref:FimV/HubP family polar landmark protein n=1 Tax=Pseudomonas sp. R5(2019) TaxID=2697566 RepID=UPI0014133055|nr:FimV/HubP family polar landmark protein [Pseudomonas sp. R5(2019)]NBA94235.1 peptidoglycan-binding protein [Pseudomonas sp. R5(2019)]
MVQVRKLVLAIAAASALSSGMAQALELGELTLKSAQNQPLLAEIELRDVDGLSAAEMQPGLALPEEFAKAGIDRQAFLDDLTFTPVVNPNGKSVLRVTSSKPLPEPFVKFVVQVRYPQGRLMRDYSVLLDPSKFSPEAAQAAGQGATPAVSGASEYTTNRRDTLWEIASRNRQGASVQQTMLAIQALNPDAFIDGNINRLKTGQVLRLPDQQQATSLPQAQAIADVAEQNAAWREGRRLGPRAQQLDATRRSQGQGTVAPAQTQDKLSLVSAGKGGANDSKALNNKLAVAQETLDTTTRSNTELKSRMADLQSQMDKLQKLIQLKNDQLARLEAGAGAKGSTPPAEAPAPISAELAAPADTAPAAILDTAATPAPAAADTAPAVDATQAPEAAEQPPVAATSEDALQSLMGNPLLLGLIAGSSVLVLLLLLLLLARRRKARQEAEKHMSMARALAEESDYPSDTFSLQDDQLEGIETPAPSVKLAPSFVAASAAAATASEGPETRYCAARTEVAADAPITAPLVAPAAEPIPDAELLARVDSLIEQRRYIEAAGALAPAVAREPQHSDLRLKLMEVHALRGDRESFTNNERQLIATGNNHAAVESLKSRFPAMLGAVAGGLSAAALAAELDAQYVKDLLKDEPEAEALPAEELDTAFDLSLDDPEVLPPAELAEEELLAAEFGELDDNAPVADITDDLLLDAPLIAEQQAPVVDVPTLDEAPARVTDPADSAEINELDFEALLAEHAEQGASSTAGNDLDDFDLDIGADPAAIATSEPVDVAAQLAEFEKDLELDDPFAALDDDLSLPEDFDLSLPDTEPAPAPAAAFKDVSAELESLSQSLGHPPIEVPTFTEQDAAAIEDEPEFDFLAGTDESATKLDLARAYIDMGDDGGARDILNEVLTEGTDVQRKEALDMLKSVKG